MEKGWTRWLSTGLTLVVLALLVVSIGLNLRLEGQTRDALTALAAVQSQQSTMGEQLRQLDISVSRAGAAATAASTRASTRSAPRKGKGKGAKASAADGERDPAARSKAGRRTKSAGPDGQDAAAAAVKALAGGGKKKRKRKGKKGKSKQGGRR